MKDIEADLLQGLEFFVEWNLEPLGHVHKLPTVETYPTPWSEMERKRLLDRGHQYKTWHSTDHYTKAALRIIGEVDHALLRKTGPEMAADIAVSYLILWREEEGGFKQESQVVSSVALIT